MCVWVRVCVTYLTVWVSSRTHRCIKHSSGWLWLCCSWMRWICTLPEPLCWNRTYTHSIVCESSTTRFYYNTLTSHCSTYTNMRRPTLYRKAPFISHLRLQNKWIMGTLENRVALTVAFGYLKIKICGKLTFCSLHCSIHLKNNFKQYFVIKTTKR